MATGATAASPVVVVAGADEAFALGLAALGISVISHRPAGRRLDFYVVDAGLSPDTRVRLETSWTADDTRVHWLHLEAAVLERCGLDSCLSRRSACIPLVFDLLMPPDVKRLLYLDADTLVLSDLTPLWDIDLDGYALAAVEDTMIPRIQADSYVPAEVATSAGLPNFNSGVALIDLDLWRGQGICATARAFQQRYHHSLWSVDQQVLNWTLAGRWKPLPLVWNRMSHLQAIPSHRCTFFSADEFGQALAHPRIAHFAGASKPWHPRCRDDRTSDFIEAMQQTAWAPWEPPRQGLASGIFDDLWREPHRQHRFIRRGLGVARRTGLPTGPWYRSAVRVSLRYPWSAVTYPIFSVAQRLRRRG